MRRMRRAVCDRLLWRQHHRAAEKIFLPPGAVTFKSARRALETIAWMPMERIMIETDSPYLTPVPFRGRRNDSSYVRLVAEKIAEVRGMRVEDVAAATMENGKRFFGIA